MARLLVVRCGDAVRIEGVSDPTDGERYEAGALLPGRHATLAGPTFQEWLDADITNAVVQTAGAAATTS
jgi:hypothetical protein